MSLWPLWNDHSLLWEAGTAQHQRQSLSCQGWDSKSAARRPRQPISDLLFAFNGQTSDTFPFCKCLKWRPGFSTGRSVPGWTLRWVSTQRQDRGFLTQPVKTDEITARSYSTRHFHGPYQDRALHTRHRWEGSFSAPSLGIYTALLCRGPNTRAQLDTGQRGFTINTRPMAPTHAGLAHGAAFHCAALRVRTRTAITTCNRDFLS